MKKLKTDQLGGHPFLYTDFEFVQEQIRELAEAAFGYTDASKITLLKGCDISISGDGYTINVTAGYVYYNGEFFAVDTHEATGSSPETAKWRIIESYDSRGTKTFADETAKETYTIRKMEVYFAGDGEEGVDISETQDGFLQATEWTEVDEGDLPLNWSYPTTPKEPLKYRKDRNGNLHIKGKVYMDSTNSTAFTLPENFRPSEDRRIMVPSIVDLLGVGSDVLDVTAELVEIKSTGEFNFYRQTSGFAINHIIIL